MGIVEPFPMFFVNCFVYGANSTYVQRDMDFRCVATPALRFLYEPLFLNENESRRFPSALSELMRGDWVDRAGSVPSFGLSEMRAFWGVDTGSLLSLALMTDTRRHVESFGNAHVGKAVPKNKFQEMFAERLKSARADARLWTQLSYWFESVGVTTLETRAVILAMQKYAAALLRYQGLVCFSNVGFWRRFCEDVVKRTAEDAPNYGFPRYVPWYWSFADYESHSNDVMGLDARWLFCSEDAFLQTLKPKVHPTTYDFFRSHARDVPADYPDSIRAEIHRVKNTLRVSFSILSIRSAAHDQKSRPLRDVFLACPVCRELRTYVVETSTDKRATKKRVKKRANVPVYKTMGTKNTTYDAQLERYVCFTKRNLCRFATCVPIRFAGKYVEFFGSLMVQCPECERVVRLNPNDPEHGRENWNCGCVVQKLEILCHRCGVPQTSSKRMWTTLLAFGGDVAPGDNVLYFCKNHHPPVWAENRAAWFYPHFERAVR
jgi:hypothetical protein